MICSSCGRTVEEGMAFCPHCGAAVIQPFMTEEDKAREAAEIEAALKSLDEIKQVASKPQSVPETQATPLGVAPAQRNYSATHRDSKTSQVIIAMIGALTLAVLLFVVLPRFIKHYPSWTPTIAETDPEEQASPIGDLPTIEELSAQDDPEEESAVIAFDAYDHPDEEKKDNPTRNDYILPDSATHLYTPEELEGLSEWSLELARNEIYARHGRGFNDSTLQAYFDSQEWYEMKYTPEEFDAQTGLLNEIELANIATIGEVEDSL